MSFIRLIIISIVLLFLSGCTGSGKQHNRPTPTQHYKQELVAIRHSKFSKQSLLNQSERKLYWKLLKDKNKYYIFTQISLGEILKHKNKYHYKAVMCKRADFCITDKQFNPVAVVEYNGKGHYNKTSDLRDSIKQTATESAGILFITITPKDVDKQVEDMWQDIKKGFGY